MATLNASEARNVAGVRSMPSLPSLSSSRSVRTVHRMQSITGLGSLAKFAGFSSAEDLDQTEDVDQLQLESTLPLGTPNIISDKIAYFGSTESVSDSDASTTEPSSSDGYLDAAHDSASTESLALSSGSPELSASSTSFSSSRSSTRRFSRTYSWSTKLGLKKPPRAKGRPAAAPLLGEAVEDVFPMHELPTKVCKKLKSQLAKYRSKHGAAKTNYLRITLLSFLREQTSPANASADMVVQILGLWWEALLDDLTGPMKNISGFDRNAYYEGLSTIMARSEWVGQEQTGRYQLLLRRTCLHVVIKSSALAHSAIPLSAFFGKVLAFSYMYLPGFALHILRVLLASGHGLAQPRGAAPHSPRSQTRGRPGPRPMNGDRGSRAGAGSAHDSNVPGASTRGRPSRAGNGASVPASARLRDSPSFPDISGLGQSEGSPAQSRSSSPSSKRASTLQIKDEFFVKITREIVRQPMIDVDRLPEHLHALCGVQELPKELPDLSWLGNFRDPACLRSLRLDSALFSSFFKHLCTLQSRFFPKNGRRDISHPEALLLSSPGMLLVFVVVVRSMKKVLSNFLLQHYVRGIAPKTVANPYCQRTASTASANAPSTSASAYATMPIKMHLDQLKIFAAMRDLLHAESLTCPHFHVFSRAFDLVFQSLALETKVFDMDACVTVCDVSEEWLSSVFLVRTSKAVPVFLHGSHPVVDWNFWITVALRMLESNNTCTEMRAITFLFNIWQHFPQDDEFLRRAAVQVLAPEVWLQLFCHWSPLVRSYYHRFVCYQVLTTSGSNEVQFFIKQLVATRLDEMYVWLRQMCTNANLMPETTPSLPLPRMRIGIKTAAANQKQPYQQLESGTKRLHPFEIFDNAAYWLNEESQPSFAPILNLQKRGNPSSPSIMSSVTAATSVSDISSTSTGNELGKTAKLSSPLQGPPELPQSPAPSSQVWMGAAQSELTNSRRESSASAQDNTLTPPLEDEVSGSGDSTVTGTADRSAEETCNNGSSTETVATTADSRTTEASTDSDISRSSDTSHTSASTATNDAESDSSKKGVKRSDLARKFSFLRKFIPRRQLKLRNSKASLEPPEAAPTPALPGRVLTASKILSPPRTPVFDENPRYSSSVRSFRPSPKSPSVHSLRAPRTPASLGASSSTTASTMEKMSKNKVSLACPPKLQEPRPEIVRSPHRFILVQTMLLPKPVKELTVPRLPFTNRKSLPQAARLNPNKKQNLLVWNYAGRSLAEWNIQVFCYEKFVEQNTRELGARSDELEMPFLVAEIPWREVQQ